MKYETLEALANAYKGGELTAKDIVTVDNDGVYLYVRAEDDEYGEDAKCVFLIEDLPRYVLVEALRLLGVPARQA